MSGNCTIAGEVKEHVIVYGDHTYEGVNSGVKVWRMTDMYWILCAYQSKLNETNYKPFKLSLYTKYLLCTLAKPFLKQAYLCWFSY